MSSTPAESQRSDLQAQARHALERISEDLLLAGTDLPLEFPAFTPPGVNPILDGSDEGPDAVEIIGHFSQDASASQPLRVVSFDGQTALLETVPIEIERGRLVLIYDNESTHGAWMFGIVSSVQEWPQPALTLLTEAGGAVDHLRLPPFISKYNRNQPRSGFVTPVTVVTYMVQADGTRGAQEEDTVLWRQVNWGVPVQVAFVEDLQIRFFVGGTVSEDPYMIYRSPPPSRDTAMARPSTSTSGQERELDHPPRPQPQPGRRLQPDDLVRGVRIFVTSRSHDANLEGSTVRSDQDEDEEGFLRVTFSTRVSPRNILYQLNARQSLEALNQ
jgi:hypothetical protein